VSIKGSASHPPAAVIRKVNMIIIAYNSFSFLLFVVSIIIIIFDLKEGFFLKLLWARANFVIFCVVF